MCCTGLASQVPQFHSPDAVPFRFTPNLQHLLGPIMTEGILAAGIMSIGRCLTEPEVRLSIHRFLSPAHRFHQNDLEHQLCLFSRDEVMTWLHQHHRGKVPQIDLTFRSQVAQNIDSVVKRAETMACKLEREQVRAIHPIPELLFLTRATPQALAQTAQTISTIPAVQTVASLISTATNPINLVKMTEMFVPWF